MKVSIRQIDIIFLFVMLSVFNVFSTFSVIIEVLGILLIIIYRTNRSSLQISGKNYYFTWAILFLIISLVTLAWCQSSIAVLYGCRGIIECFLFGLSINMYILNEHDIISFFKVLVVAAVVLLIRILITTPFSSILARELEGGLNSNSVGLQFVIAALAALWLIKEKYTVGRKYYLVLIMLSLGIIVSGSKKAIIAIIVGIVVYRILYAKNIFSTLKHLIGICLALMLIYFLCMNVESLYEIIGKRFEGMINAFKLGRDYGDASTYERLTLVEYAVQMWEEKPFLGYGINCFEYITSFSMYTHCNYVELLFGVGIIGTIIFYSIYIWIIRWSLRFMKQYNFFVFALACVAIFLISDIGYVSYGDLFYNVMISFMCSIIGMLRTQGRISL